MSDETYRPSKQPINSNDLRGPAENQTALNEVTSMQNAARGDSHSGASPDVPGIQITGNVPPQFLAAQQQSKNKKVNVGRQRPAANDNSKQVQAAGSNQFENLIQRVRSNTNSYEKIVLPSKGKFYDGIDGPRD